MSFKCYKCDKPIKPKWSDRLFTYTHKLLCYKCWQASKNKTNKALHDANQRIRNN